MLWIFILRFIDFVGFSMMEEQLLISSRLILRLVPMGFLYVLLEPAEGFFKGTDHQRDHYLDDHLAKALLYKHLQ